MRDHKTLIECLEIAQRHVARLAWALSLHVANTSEVDQEVHRINDTIDEAIERLKIDEKALQEIESGT